MRAPVLALLLLLLVLPDSEARAAPARRIAILIGGSGEEKKAENFFTADFNRLRSHLEARGWETRVAFAGARHRLERSVPARPAEIDGLFVDAARELRKGDQALVVLHSHGFPRWEEFEESHSL